jgi:hypothetical protein
VTRAPAQPTTRPSALATTSGANVRTTPETGHSVPIVPAVTDERLVAIAVDRFHPVADVDLLRDTTTDLLDLVRTGDLGALAVDLTARPGGPGEPAALRTSLLARLPAVAAARQDGVARVDDQAWVDGEPAGSRSAGRAWSTLTARLRPLARWYGLRVVVDVRETEERIAPFAPSCVTEVARPLLAPPRVDGTRLGFSGAASVRTEPNGPSLAHPWPLEAPLPGSVAHRLAIRAERRLLRSVQTVTSATSIRVIVTATSPSVRERTALTAAADAARRRLGPDVEEAASQANGLAGDRRHLRVTVLVSSSGVVPNDLLDALGRWLAPEGPIADVRRLRAEAAARAWMQLRTPAARGERRWQRTVPASEVAAAFRLPAAGEYDLPGLSVARHRPRLEVHDAPTGTRLGIAGDGLVASEVHLGVTDRLRHLVVIGQTGVGKSTMVADAAIADVERGDGVAVIDPTGDLIEHLLGRLPLGRADDVVLIQPGADRVVGCNLLEAEDPQQARFLVSELCAGFATLFDPQRQGIVGPRFEAMLRNGALTLMADPTDPVSLLELPRLYVDEGFRRDRVARCDDPLLQEFWSREWEQTQPFHRSEVLGWFRSKFEPFRMDPNLRAVLGQARSTISMREVLDEGRILLVDLSKGALGGYSSALLGFVVTTRIWAAALGRAGQPPATRRPFRLYIDEFQNFTTSSLPEMLPEARKYGLSLTLANQHLGQLAPDVRRAVLGNVGSRVVFRVGPEDAHEVASWLGEDVTPAELQALPNHTAVATLLQDGAPRPPITLMTVPPPEATATSRARAAEVRARSLERHGRPRAEVEAEFIARYRATPDGRTPRRGASTTGLPGGRLEGRAGATPGRGLGHEPDHSFLDQWLERRRAATRPPDTVSDDLDPSVSENPDGGNSSPAADRTDAEGAA